MSFDLSQDPRFTELPQRFQDELKDIPPTGIVDGETWHEVQFEMSGIMCQCAVVNRKYVALPTSETAQFTRILRVLPPEEKKDIPSEVTIIPCCRVGSETVAAHDKGVYEERVCWRCGYKILANAPTRECKEQMGDAAVLICIECLAQITEDAR